MPVLVALAILATAMLLCPAPRAEATRGRTVAAGDPTRGLAIIAATGCAACHSVPGIRWPQGVVGPPLDAMGRRALIAGTYPNSPANMAAWIYDPPALKPGTGMPKLGLDAQQTIDVTAYLMSLR